MLVEVLIVRYVTPPSRVCIFPLSINFTYQPPYFVSQPSHRLGLDSIDKNEFAKTPRNSSSAVDEIRRDKRHRYQKQVEIGYNLSWEILEREDSKLALKVNAFYSMCCSAQ
jgi:hypothetical protein